MSSLLQNVIVAHRCRSTHHFIVMEAINLFSGPDAEGWQALLLAEHMSLLQGAKAPDTEFKDFKNHVLHVSEGEWGGARDAAAEWYGKAVAALRLHKWSNAAYALGVLSHYYSDPLQPFHTGQTEEEGAIHRAVEWSIAKSRAEIARRIEEKGYPDVPAGTGPGFVSEMVLEGAKRSHPHYRTFIDHYDIHAGVKDPPAGLDETMLDAIADLCAHATRGIAVLFERAVAEAAVKPKKVNLSLHGYLATIDIPIRWVTQKMDDAASRNTVTAMYKELQETGKVIRKLPDDDKAIRKLHARDVLRIPVKELDARPAAPTGTKHTPRPDAAPTPAGSAEPKVLFDPVEKDAFEPKTLFKPQKAGGEADKVLFPSDADAKAVEAVIEPPTPSEPDPAPGPAIEVAVSGPATAAALPEEGEDDTPATAREPGDEGRLTRESDVIDAPSIGPKTSERLNKIGIFTIGDLLDADAGATADKLDARHLPADTVRDWQDQTHLMMAMPSLRVHDAQILVGANIRTVEALAEASVKDLLDASMSFVESPEAKRMINKSSWPDEEEVDEWIGMAKAAG